MSLLLRALDLMKLRLAEISVNPNQTRNPWVDAEELKGCIQKETRRLEALGKEPASKVPPPSHHVAVASSTPVERPVGASARDEKDDHPETKAGPVKGKVAQSLKIDSERVDSVLNMVGELVVLKSQLFQLDTVQKSGDQRTAAIFGLFDRTIRDLYEKTLSMRMTSLKPLFLKMQRSVRDLSAKLGKDVDFQVEGEETELDRALIELMADPILHMCRNAMDHGLESPKERARVGKNPRGKITLRAAQRGGSVVIEVSDDGPGVNRDRVIAKAVEKGMLPNAEAGQALSDMEVSDFLFKPGFSTAKQVTDVSGRGVGLDVVRSNIEAAKGKVEIDSKVGAGTTFRLFLPLTTAITDGIVLEVGGERYIMPIDLIREFVQPGSDSITLVDQGREVANVRGEYLPLLRLGELFGHSDVKKGVIVVAQMQDTRFSLMVDQVLGQTQVVLKNLDGELTKNEHVSGGAIMGDGRVGLVLDMAAITGKLNANTASGVRVA
jgi:two-component system chemotaxis sensor kinase CheA